MIPLPIHIASLRPYQSARSLYKGDGWIFMDANESPVVGDAAGMESVSSLALRANLNRYPDPTADALRQTISAFYGLAVENVMMANGSDELIDLAVRSFVRPGRSVAALAPSYGMYRVSAEANEAALAAVRLRPDFGVDQAALRAALESADLLFLCSPNNPTGTVLEPGLIERLAAGFPGLVVVDEAYGEFADAEGVPSAIGLVRRGVENLIVLRTFSKAFGAAGIRLGYAVACSALIDVLLRVKPPYNVSVLSQTAGLALWGRRELMEANVQTLIAGRTRLMRGCERLGCTVFPSTANFFLFRPPPAVSAQTLHEALIASRRLVLRRFAGTPRLEDLLRVSVGSPEHNDLLLTSIAEILP